MCEPFENWLVRIWIWFGSTIANGIFASYHDRGALTNNERHFSFRPPLYILLWGPCLTGRWPRAST